MSGFEITGFYSSRAARMADRDSYDHVLKVWPVSEDDYEHELLHPETCTVWVRSKPDSWGNYWGYDCAVTSEIEAVGFDAMFPDGLREGIFLLSPWFHRTPSTPNGPEEYDAGIDVTRLEEVTA